MLIKSLKCDLSIGCEFPALRSQQYSFTRICMQLLKYIPASMQYATTALCRTAYFISWLNSGTQTNTAISNTGSCHAFCGLVEPKASKHFLSSEFLTLLWTGLNHNGYTLGFCPPLQKQLLSSHPFSALSFLIFAPFLCVIILKSILSYFRCHSPNSAQTSFILTDFQHWPGQYFAITGPEATPFQAWNFPWE